MEHAAYRCIESAEEGVWMYGTMTLRRSNRRVAERRNISHFSHSAFGTCAGAAAEGITVKLDPGPVGLAQ